MTRPLTNDFNALTGEYVSREMDDQELAQYEADITKATTEKETQIALIEAEKQAKDKAAQKLAALGLDIDDLQALGLVKPVIEPVEPIEII